MPVETGWAPATAPGPLRAFFLRIRNKRVSRRSRSGRKRARGLDMGSAGKGTGLLLGKPGAGGGNAEAARLKAGAPDERGTGRRGPAHAWSCQTARNAPEDAKRVTNCGSTLAATRTEAAQGGETGGSSPRSAQD